MQNDELEELLQSGLKSYGDAEPLSGLEDRVLRHVHGRRARRGWTWFGWAGATASACLLLLAVVFGYRADWLVPDGSAHRADASLGAHPPADGKLTDAQESSLNAAAGPELQAGHARAGKSLAAKQIRASPERLPKLEMFPTPHPLSSEERALVEFVNKHPQEVQQLADAEGQSLEPIQIAAIHIEPLTMDGPQPEGEKNAKDQ
jgi:hypothetical protein